MATAQATPHPRNLTSIKSSSSNPKPSPKKPSQEQIRKALEQAGLTASQADDCSIYASHRVRNDVPRNHSQFWTMKAITLAVVEHLQRQQVSVGPLPDHKLASVIAGLLDEWDDLMPISARRTGGAA